MLEINIIIRDLSEIVLTLNDIPTLKKITLTSQKWDECIHRLTQKQKALTLISFTNRFIWFTELSSCHHMCVWESKRLTFQEDTDICGLLVLKGFDLLILTFVTFVCVFALFFLITCTTWINCNVRYVVKGGTEGFALLMLEGLSYAEMQCIILKKGIYIIVIVYCTVPWNWHCQLYMYRCSF